MIARAKVLATASARFLCRRLLLAVAQLGTVARRGAAASLITALLLPALLTALLTISSAPAHAEQRTLRVGVGSNPPIAFKDSSGEMQGIAVDVLNDVAEKEGWQLQFVHDDWQALLGMLDRGEIDLQTGIAYTPERAERFQFTRQTLLSNWGVVYARPGSKIQSLLALQDKRVALVPGATHSDELSELVDKLGVRIVALAAEDYQQVLAMVAAGTADAGVVSRVFGTLHAATYELESTGVVFNPISVRYAAPRDADPAIVETLDRHLEALLARRDTAYYASLDRWLGNSRAASLPAWVAWTLIGSAGTLGLAVFFVFLLRRQVRRRTAALHDSEESFRATFEQAAVGIAQVAPDGSWLEVNQRLCDIVGYSREEMLQLSFQDITHPDDLAADLQLVGEALAATRQTYTLEKRYLHKSGAIVWVRLTVALLRGEDRAAKYFIAVIEDVTDRKLTEAALGESDERLRMFIDHAPAALAMFDRQMRYLSVSRRWLSDYGLADAKVVGRSHYEIFPEIAEAWKDVHRRAMAGEVVRAEEDHFERHDGSVQWLRWEVRPWHAADGAVGGIVIFTEDISARKLAEASARRGELLLDSVFQALPDLFFLMDADGTIRDYRARQDAELYVPPEAFLGRCLQDVLPAEIGSMVASKMAEIGECGGLATYDYELPIGDDLRHFEARLTRLPDDGPFLAVVRDITREHQSRLSLAISEARYRTLFEYAPDGIVIVDPAGYYADANPALGRMLGYTRAELIGLHASTIVVASEYPHVAPALDAIRAGADYHREWLLQRKDGSTFVADVIATTMPDGSPLAVIRDITAIKHAEASLREQEEFFRLIAENMGDMVTVVDLEGHRLYSSPAYRALFGEPADLPGSDAFASIHPDDRERVRRGFQQTIESGAGQRGSFRVVLADGSSRDIESQGGVIRDADDRVERVVVVSRDVTEHRQMVDEISQLNSELEERVRQRTDELAAANKALRTFTYSVSHDLKAPLRGIDGYSQLLLESYHTLLDAEGRLFLDNVRKGVAQMSRLIEDLLTYSRMERHSVHRQTLDLSQQVTLVLDDRRADIEASGTIVKVELHGLSAHGDPEGLTMILRNLVDNALKFARHSQPPTLTISANQTEQSVVLAFSDNGIGFDMQFHDRIFEIFQRLQRAEDYSGTGVGLAIVDKAAQRMGGRTWGESAPGHGATFYLELPR
ncbi:PAS domain S-box protein [Candidatus Accumulibacter sp. ACC003]|uniref:PAS domain S-box protein n=1 Tax=Candidatus Accumulibacter sp. ACC003 TaxID=2823334 RepID=UPI0025C604E6|nr:PAS domain S-box protein [Candidatus Accumulibacter sp. ACC003]